MFEPHAKLPKQFSSSAKIENLNLFICCEVRSKKNTPDQKCSFHYLAVVPDIPLLKPFDIRLL